jgi:RNase adaptor protein for sRNA GlmZ degradation
MSVLRAAGKAVAIVEMRVTSQKCVPNLSTCMQQQLLQAMQTAAAAAAAAPHAAVVVAVQHNTNDANISSCSCLPAGS